MQQTLAVKLAPTVEQRAALIATLECFNAACNAIAQVAFRERLANKFALQKIVYYSIRERLGLSSQMTIRAIAKVVEAYKRDKTIQPNFRLHGALTYDERIMSWHGLEHVSLLAVDGRQLVAYRPGDYQQARWDRLHGQADLILRDGTFYLYATLEVPDVPTDDVPDYLGVDLGIVNIAVDSDASVYTGEQVEQQRRAFAHRRRNLQRRQTRAAKRKLQSLRRKQARFQTNSNHCISERATPIGHSPNSERSCSTKRRVLGCQSCWSIPATRRKRALPADTWSGRIAHRRHVSSASCVASLDQPMPSRHASLRRVPGLPVRQPNAGLRTGKVAGVVSCIKAPSKQAPAFRHGVI